MNYIGKIFVFSVFVMSLVLMTFAGAIFMSHTNWEREINRKPEECRVGEKPGYAYQLKQADDTRKTLQDEITRLSSRVADSEQARDQVLAKLQAALVEKDGELKALRGEKDEREAKLQKALAEMDVAQAALKQANEDVEKLRTQVAEQQQKVDVEVTNAAKLAVELEEQKSFLAIATERKAQLEKQVANARLLLKQSGLTLESLPKDRVPTLDGNVLAVADNSIQVSIGGDDGLQVGHTLEVYRDGQYVGRAVVRAVKPDHAVAELVKEFARGVVQRGDKVTTRLKA